MIPVLVKSVWLRNICFSKLATTLFKFIDRFPLPETTEGGSLLNMVNIPIVTTRPFSLPCYLQGSENGRVVTIGKHSRLNRQIWYRHLNSEAGNDEIQNFQRGDFYFVGITF